MSYRITVITPSYNQAEFIKETLDSVAQQTHHNIEHIVVDGGSKDGTTQILKDHKKSTADEEGYDFIWTSEPDEGQSDAINKGFERATGEIVAWLNSDDVYFDINVLSRVDKYFERLDADIIYGDQCYINQNSIITAVDPRPDFDQNKLPYRILLSQPATFFRSEVIKNQKLDANLEYSMDYEYWLRLSQSYKFTHVPEIFAGFRSYSAQKSQDQSAMANELQEILTEYDNDQKRWFGIIFDNAVTEIKRMTQGVTLIYQLHRNPPNFAFNASLSPTSKMFANLGPGWGDVEKAWRRWRTDGQSG